MSIFLRTDLPVASHLHRHRLKTKAGFAARASIKYNSFLRGAQGGFAAEMTKRPQTPWLSEIEKEIIVLEKGKIVIEKEIFITEKGKIALEKRKIALERGIVAIEQGGLPIERRIIAIEEGEISIEGAAGAIENVDFERGYALFPSHRASTAIDLIAKASFPAGASIKYNLCR